jgi:hypothetical protein
MCCSAASFQESHMSREVGLFNSDLAHLATQFQPWDKLTRKFNEVFQDDQLCEDIVSIQSFGDFIS